ncbi:MAG: YCF48-related protein [Candidatus Solibacter sp.]
MTTTTRKRVGWLLALGVIPLFVSRVTFAADERSCNMRDAALPNDQITYVLCEQGLLLVTKDDGATWAQRKIPIKDSILRAVSFHDVNHGLVVGDDGSIFATENAGVTWTARKSGTTENLTDIQMLGDEGWIAGYDGVILHTADGGKTWAKQDSGSAALSLEALYFHDTQNGWAVGWAGSILHTVDGGKKWQTLKVNGASWSLSCITFTDAQNGWIVGFAGQLLATKDGGATWEARKPPAPTWLSSIGFDSKKRAWITTDIGFLLSEDGGQTWSVQPTDGQLFINKIVRNTGTAWALGPFGMLKQTGAGLEWKKILNPLSSAAAAEDTGIFTAPTTTAK